MYATSDVEDALAATREFLLPFEWSRWWRLALVALFLSSGTAMNPPTFQAGFGGGGRGPTGPDVPLDAVPIDLIALAVVLALIGVVLAIVFALVGAIMEFVLVESLRNERVTVRQYAGRRWRQGIQLFVFNVVVGLVAVAVAGALLGIGFAPLVLADSFVLTAIAMVFVVPLLLAVGILAAATLGFTSAFVVPTMVAEDLGVLDGWRRFWPVLRREAKEYLAYALVYVALVLVAGVAAGTVAAVGGVLLAIPFGLVAAVGVALLGVVDLVGVALLVVAGACWVLSLIVLFAFVQVPVVTFLRYYSLFLLGDTEASLDLVAERRAAVRDEATDA